MKRVMTAALVLSLLSGTSALAQQGEGRGGRDRGEGREQRQERREQRPEQKQQRQERREERREARPEGAERREQAPPPQQAQQRPEQRRGLTVDRRERPQAQPRQQQPQRDRARPPQQQQPRAGDGERRGWTQDRDRDRRPEARRDDDRRDWNRERDNRRPDARRDNDRRGDWARGYRPGDGRQVRDRDRGRSWYSADQWRRSYNAPRRYRAPAYRYPSGWYARSWVWGDLLPRSWYSSSYYLDYRYYGLPRPPIGTEWVRVRDDALLVDVWTGRVLTVYYDLFW